MKLVKSVILLAFIVVLMSCTDDEGKTSNPLDVTGLGVYDNTLFDNVFFVDIIKDVDEAVEENLVGFVVLKENCYLDSVLITVDGIEYEMNNIGGGLIWTGSLFEDAITDENTTHDFQINAIGFTLVDDIQEEYIFSQTFSLTNCTFTNTINFPDSLYINEVEGNETIEIVQDAYIEWTLANNNDYQIIIVNESPFANPDDYEIALDVSDRIHTVLSEEYLSNYKTAEINLTQLNVYTEERFVAYSAYEVFKNYSEETRDISLFDRIIKKVKFIR